MMSVLREHFPIYSTRAKSGRFMPSAELRQQATFAEIDQRSPRLLMGRKLSIICVDRFDQSVHPMRIRKTVQRNTNLKICLREAILKSGHEAPFQKRPASGCYWTGVGHTIEWKVTSRSTARGIRCRPAIRRLRSLNLTGATAFYLRVLNRQEEKWFLFTTHPSMGYKVSVHFRAGEARPH